MNLENVYQWLDLLWLPVMFYTAGKKLRIKAVLFVLACVGMLRLQVELMTSIGFNAGILSFWQWPALYKGMAIYGVLIGILALLNALSKETDPYVFMAASISVFILGFCISSVVMVL